MKKRRFWVILVALVTALSMIFSLVGCNPSNNGGSNGGEPGKSAYEIWLEAGHVGNVDDYLNWVRGEKCKSGGGCSCYPSLEPSDPFVEPSEFYMPEKGFDSATPVTITFYHTMGRQFKDVLDDAVERFNILYPNITVNCDSEIGNYDALYNRVSWEIPRGKQPNLAFCYPDHVALYNSMNAVLRLDDFLPNGAYKDMTVTTSEGKAPLTLTREQLDNYIPAYFYEGSVYGDEHTYTLPLAKSTEVLYYNKTFFKENAAKFGWDFTGKTDEEISVALDEKLDGRTWEEIFDICKMIKGNEEEGVVGIKPDCTPLGIESEENLFITLCEQYGTPYTSATGDHFLFNNDANKAFMQKFKDWFKDGYFTTETINKAYTSNLFKEQKSYLSIGSSAGAQYQAPALVSGKAPFEVGIVSIPQANPEKPKSILKGPSLCIFKQADPQEVLASWLFAKFLTTDLQFQAEYSMISGYLPVLQSVLENPVYQDHLNAANGYSNGIAALSAKVCTQLVDKQAFYISPAFFGSSEARTQVGILMVKVITAQQTIDEAFTEAINACKQYIS